MEDCQLYQAVRKQLRGRRESMKTQRCPRKQCVAVRRVIRIIRVLRLLGLLVLLGLFGFD